MSTWAVKASTPSQKGKYRVVLFEDSNGDSFEFKFQFENRHDYLMQCIYCTSFIKENKMSGVTPAKVNVTKDYRLFVKNDPNKIRHVCKGKTFTEVCTSRAEMIAKEKLDFSHGKPSSLATDAYTALVQSPIVEKLSHEERMIVSSGLTRKKLQKNFAYARRIAQPPNPSRPGNISPEHRFLTNSGDEIIKLDRTNCIVYFNGPSLLKLLDNGVEVFMADGVFDFVPTDYGGGDHGQLYTMLGVIKEAPYYFFNAVCRKKDEKTYTECFEIIKTFLERQNPVYMKKLVETPFMIDFEQAACNALYNVFKVQVHGCLFHYAQSINRKARSTFGGNLEKSEISAWVGRCRAACFFPAAWIENLQIFEPPASFDPQFQLSAQQFADYLKRTWLGRFRHWFTHFNNYRHRTTNFVESFHNTLSYQMDSVRPSLSSFYTQMLKIHEVWASECFNLGLSPPQFKESNLRKKRKERLEKVADLQNQLRILLQTSTTSPSDLMRMLDTLVEFTPVATELINIKVVE